MQNIVEGHNLSIGYRNGKKIQITLSNLHFSLRKGELTCLLGTNGVGKTTFLRTLAATQPYFEGELLLHGKPIQSYTDSQRAKLIGVVLTDKAQAGGLTVREIVALGRQPHTGFFGRLTANDYERISDAMQAVGISHKAQSYFAHLSDGERQKVMIAKALVQECPLILLDEPTAFLDVASRLEILKLLHELAHTQQKAILLTTHDIEQSLVLADRLWIVNTSGELITGTTEDLVLQHQMDQLFREKDIKFDLMHGIFSPTVAGQKQIVLETQDEILRHWTQNALNRNGYLCLEASPIHAHLPHLYVESAKEFRFATEKDTHTFDSFDSLLAEISQKSH